jgi:hypothetical protein
MVYDRRIGASAHERSEIIGQSYGMPYLSQATFQIRPSEGSLSTSCAAEREVLLAGALRIAIIQFGLASGPESLDPLPTDGNARKDWLA